MSKSPPLLTLNDIYLSFGGNPIFSGITLGIHPKDRICLVGRNGSGKSTLFKIIAGLIECDSGERFVKPGIRIAMMEQSVIPPQEMTALEYIQRQKPETQAFQIEEILQHLDVDPNKSMQTLSGGESRRVSLASSLVTKPEILLLDEPTNHLDMPTIEWLEDQIRSYNGAVVIISHDRYFLSKLSKRTFWLDRGGIKILEDGYSGFEEWSETILDNEIREQEKLDQKIAEETEWLHKGVTARRKRNQGRLRQLMSMRETRSSHVGKKGSIEFAESSGEVSSKHVIDVRQISKSFEKADGTHKDIVKNFSTRIQRGDRIGIIGPNGSGKTTLVKMLLSELKPDKGFVKIAKNLEVARFEQDHSSLKPDDTPWDVLCPGGGDQVMVQNTPRHVMGYLRDFLFERKQARSPIASLSGGEKNRLLLAKILASPSNLLVLDEPTNDLDMDSLDLLQEYLDQYPGTLIIVSHDRDFLDRTTTSLIAVEGEGDVAEYIGGYEDYLRGRPRASKKSDAGEKKPSSETKADDKPKSDRSKVRLSYHEVRALEILPKQIDELRKAIVVLEEELSDPSLYQKNPGKFDEVSKKLQSAKSDLEAKENEWLELEIKAEEISS